MTRHCADCGVEVPAKKVRPIVSGRQRTYASRTKPVRCTQCRGVPTECPQCGETFIKTHSSGETCGRACGHAKALETNYGKPQGRRYSVARPRPRVVMPVEWRGSAIDKVRAIRGEAWA